MRSLLRELFRALVRRNEVWFDFEIPNPRGDILFIQHALVRPKVGNVTEAKTILINLSRHEDDLWSEASKDTKYEIRRAERDGAQMRIAPQDDREMLEQFSLVYRELEIRKSLPSLDHARLKRLHEGQALIISTGSPKNGSPLSWHVYVAVGARVRLLHSVSRLLDSGGSAARQEVGRINRMHHWRDILHFRSRGFEFYDFGGWVGKDGDPILRSISAFKEGFGGQVVDCYSSVVPRTLWGRLSIFFHARLAR